MECRQQVHRTGPVEGGGAAFADGGQCDADERARHRSGHRPFEQRKPISDALWADVAKQRFMSLIAYQTAMKNAGQGGAEPPARLLATARAAEVVMCLRDFDSVDGCADLLYASRLAGRRCIPPPPTRHRAGDADVNAIRSYLKGLQQTPFPPMAERPMTCPRSPVTARCA